MGLDNIENFRSMLYGITVFCSIMAISGIILLKVKHDMQSAEKRRQKTP